LTVTRLDRGAVMTAEIQSTDLDERISRIVQKLLRGELQK
jgi:hypothetical protein